MSENFNTPNNDMEDITSNSTGNHAKMNPLVVFGKNMFENLSNVIKIIAFVLGFGIIALSILLAFFLFSKSLLSLFISLAIIIVGTLFAAALFFPIYGIGHIIEQNEEILKKL